MLLLFTNAMIYNNHYHEVHVMAVEMCAQFEDLIRDLEEQEMHDNPELAASTLVLPSLMIESDNEEAIFSFFLFFFPLCHVQRYELTVFLA